MDYELQIKIKNAPLLNMMRQYGLENAAQLSRKTGIGQSELGKMLNMKYSPFLANGEMRKSVSDVCEFFCCAIDDIWPEENLYNPLKNNDVKRQVSFEQLQSLEQVSSCPTIFLENLDDYENAGFDKMVNRLTPREKSVLSMRFVEGLTLGEVAKKEGVSRGRLWHIEQKAIYKLRHPIHRENLLEGAGKYGNYLK